MEVDDLGAGDRRGGRGAAGDGGTEPRDDGVDGRGDSAVSDRSGDEHGWLAAGQDSQVGVSVWAMNRLSQWLLDYRRPVVVAAHAVLWATAYFGAFLLRFDFAI